jgi:hypothetical protein
MKGSPVRVRASAQRKALENGAFLYFQKENSACLRECSPDRTGGRSRDACVGLHGLADKVVAVALRKKVGALVAEPQEPALRDVIPERTGLER